MSRKQTYDLSFHLETFQCSWSTTINTLQQRILLTGFANGPWLPQDITQFCIAFYHATIDYTVQDGFIRILVCTDAVRMGCDMRNIERVILWGMPPSFCALVQRAGRAARDVTKLGEAILIIPVQCAETGCYQAKLTEV
ncbi:P-loop containing nucleoside triphosphate hydrolase protein [Suillus discolor]|uniref:P-loop containing nucleoside triphosphate hydrolase protein n=1 Tax=Suillus discolor TaxID=1912936 RepID=A0A9P7JW71_9AGAM|nr:P-loop containing nucleoside triphosphate hydrolase protein [Suillus discolor]KAG2111943.1 P-loop containing nucleoside triphosphate hydrolase protein [Suillus discolor]